MSQPTPYWQAVHQVLAQLPHEVIYITSVEDIVRGQVGGRVCAVDRDVAAQRLVERSHQLSTQEEIERERRDSAERSRVCAETEFRRRLEKTGPTIQLSDEQALRLGVIPGQAPPPPPASGKQKGA